MAFSTSICHCHCNYTKSFNLHLPFDNNALRFSHTKQHAPKLQVRENLVSSSAAYPETRLSEDTAEEDLSIRNSNYSDPDVDFVSRFSNLDDRAKRVRAKSLEKHHLVQSRAKIGLNSARGERFKLPEDKPMVDNDVRSVRLIEIADNNNHSKVKFEQKAKKPKEDAPPASTTLRLGLDMCSKRGDIIGAIKLYDLAKRDGIKLGEYHYAVLLYLFSSAATGALKPAKSGSSARSLNLGEPLNEKLTFSFDTVRNFSGIANQIDNEVEESNAALHNGKGVLWEVSTDPQSLHGLVESMKNSDYSKTDGTKLSGSIKRAALKKGLELLDEMVVRKIPMTEPILTSVARMAVASGDGHMAFDTVKKMKDYGINPRLRSYGPALATFCNNGDVESAFKVEEHMLENGVHPEEPELEALLRVSVESGKSDKVYYVLHKLRTNVRRVSNTTADLIELWFKSKPASRMGKRKSDRESIVRTIEANGGGWHGKGWLGSGKWNVSRTNINSEGFCKNCGEKLATIDLDPEETDSFARSVASIASQREKNSGFQKFQKWLDHYGPFEAVVDAANIGLYSQRKFKPSKVNVVVDGIRQMLPSRKWPLIVLHNRRVNGPEMDGPGNRILIERWKKADALYLTPTGSNDDWYWLYAAIKCKSLIVTNDEMRDHLFQLLGSDFFPKWKERHQVRFGFGEAGPVFYMPPPCSVVVQESERGHWHIPVVMSEDDGNEDARTWLCCTRSSSSSVRVVEDKRGTRIESESVLLSSDDSVVQQLEDAEKLGGCVVDFQI